MRENSHRDFSSICSSLWQGRVDLRQRAVWNRHWVADCREFSTIGHAIGNGHEIIGLTAANFERKRDIGVSGRIDDDRPIEIFLKIGTIARAPRRLGCDIARIAFHIVLFCTERKSTRPEHATRQLRTILGVKIPLRQYARHIPNLIALLLRLIDLRVRIERFRLDERFRTNERIARCHSCHCDARISPRRARQRPAHRNVFSHILGAVRTRLGRHWHEAHFIGPRRNRSRFVERAVNISFDVSIRNIFDANPRH